LRKCCERRFGLNPVFFYSPDDLGLREERFAHPWGAKSAGQLKVALCAKTYQEKILLLLSLHTAAILGWLSLPWLSPSAAWVYSETGWGKYENILIVFGEKVNPLKL
jgi:hypothetical protein